MSEPTNDATPRPTPVPRPTPPPSRDTSVPAEPRDAAGSHPEDGADSGSGTGHPEVDAVIASTEDLQDRPVAEHVEVFESAHDRLRSALADAGNQPTDQSTGRPS